MISAKVRGHINHFLYKLGCWIQGKSLTLFLIGITTLLGLCVGLKQTKIETDIEKLWVDSEYRLIFIFLLEFQGVVFMDAFLYNESIAPEITQGCICRQILFSERYKDSIDNSTILY